MNKYSFFFQCLDQSHSAPLESSIVVAPSDAVTKVYSYCGTVGGHMRKLGEIPCIVPLSTLPTT